MFLTYTIVYVKEEDRSRVRHGDVLGSDVSGLLEYNGNVSV